MSKKRIILVSVISTCVLLIFLAMLGVFQESKKTREAQDAARSAEKQARGKGASFGSLTREGWELRAEALKVLQEMIEGKEGRKAQLDNPVIKFSLTSGGEEGGPIVEISASKGDADMGPKSRRLNLAEKVELNKDVKITIQDTTITVPRLFCDIKNKRAYTEDRVEIAQEGIILRGEGIEVNGETETASIKRNVSITIANAGELLIFGEEEANKEKTKDQSKGKEGESVEITCDGGLTFEGATKKATLSSNVRIKRGTMVMRADKLEVTFDPKERKPTQIVALGNVRASDVPPSDAKSEYKPSGRAVECARLEWQDEEKRAILEGSPSDDPANPTGKAKIKEKSVEVASSIIELYPKGPEIVARKGGYLIATRSMSPPKTEPEEKQAKKEASDVSRFRIEWDQSMEYRKDPASKVFRALFSGDVKVESREIKLRTDKLEATFDPEGHELQRFEARGLPPQEGTEQPYRNKLVFMPPKRGSRDKESETDGKSGLFGASADSGSPIEISCAGRITFAATEHRVVFDEDVQVRRGDSSMSSRRLEITLNEENSDLTNMTATGRAEIIDERLKMRAREICFAQIEDQITGKGPGEIHLTIDRKEKSGKAAADDEAPSEKIQNIDVTWKGDMIFKRKEGVARFYDDVEAKGGEGDRKINCDELQVVLDENGEMKLVRALENVRINDPTQKIKGRGDEFILDAQTERITFLGAPAVMSKDDYRVESKRIVQTEKEKFECEGEGTLTISLSDESDLKARDSSKSADREGGKVIVKWADKMDFDGAKGQGNFYGDVSASEGRRRMQAQSLHVLLDRDPNAETPIRKVIAEREVRMIEYAVVPKPGVDTEIEMEGEGDRLTWDYASDLAILTGAPNARLYQQGTWVVAKEFHVSDKDKSVKTRGRSFMSISSRGD